LEFSVEKNGLPDKYHETSFLDSHSTGSVDPDPEGQNNLQKRKKLENFMFRSAGFSL
jgi:hypothetical protein